VIGKLFERVIFARALAWFQSHAISKLPQFGFRPHSSTHDAVFTLRGIIHAHKVLASSSFPLLTFLINKYKSWNKCVMSLTDDTCMMTHDMDNVVGDCTEAMLCHVPGSEEGLPQHQSKCYVPSDSVVGVPEKASASNERFLQTHVSQTSDRCTVNGCFRNQRWR
jgi:hypothetical protein